MNAISETDIKMAEAVKCNVKQVTIEPVTTVIENSSNVSGNVGDDNEEENSNIVAMTDLLLSLSVIQI